MEKILCKRCLLQDLGGHPYHESVLKYRSGLPSGQRTSDQEYQARLAFCRACPQLQQATCALCGCYVEMRAAKKQMHCPDAPAQW